MVLLHDIIFESAFYMGSVVAEVSMAVSLGATSPKTCAKKRHLEELPLCAYKTPPGCKYTSRMVSQKPLQEYYLGPPASICRYPDPLERKA